MSKKLLIRVFLSFVIWVALDAIFSHILLSGLERNYGLRHHSEVFAVGHSHLMMALDKKQIEDELGVKMSKYTREGMNMSERLIMTKQFMLSPYADSIRFAIIGVDIYSFQENGLSENSYLQFYPFIDYPSIGKYIAAKCSSSDYYQHKLIRLTRYSDDLMNASIRGWMNDDTNRKMNVFDISIPESSLKKWMRSIGFNHELKNSLDSIITLLKRPGIRTILVNTPTLYIVNRYQPERYNSIISYYHELARNNDDVFFLDLNPIYQDSIHLFSDPVHMNVEGRKRVTSELINYIHGLDEFETEQ